MFSLNSALDVSALARTFERDRRVQVKAFLSGDGAARLYEALRNRNDWTQVLSGEDKAIDLSRAVRSAMSEKQQLALDQAVYAGARYGFQYRYESIRITDSSNSNSSDILENFTRWLSSAAVIEFLKSVTGDAAVTFVDAQATAYSPGDFLTGHDDAVSGKYRRAAYVFNLTPIWRIEWGGLLLFHSAVDETTYGLRPSFNTLNLFAVPQMHSVSEVTKAAPYRRYSITGWLREKRDETV